MLSRTGISVETSADNVSLFERKISSSDEVSSLFEGLPSSLSNVIRELFFKIDEEFSLGTNSSYKWMKHSCKHHPDPERIKRNLAKDIIEEYASLVGLCQAAALCLRTRGMCRDKKHRSTFLLRFRNKHLFQKIPDVRQKFSESFLNFDRNI